jgi:hypothetical protein
LIRVVQHRTEARTVSGNLLNDISRQKYKRKNPNSNPGIITISLIAFLRPFEQPESKFLKVKALYIYSAQFVSLKLLARPMCIKSEVRKVLSPSHSWVNREYVCEVNIII